MYCILMFILSGPQLNAMCVSMRHNVLHPHKTFAEIVFNYLKYIYIYI